MNIYLSIIFLLLGTSLVFYSMSPYFSALGLTIVSISSCFLLTQTGMSFLAFILLLVYMGGMLIVFIYSSALSADRFPIISNINEIIILCLFITSWTIFLFNNNNWNNLINNNISNLVSIEGASFLFSSYFFLFFICAAYILLITLIAVLNISNETESFSLRAL
uniref:NADH dehydrogenase subunit 6 n=1 Tax=Comanthus parvicirrus TaxID=1529418 RepID=UPI001EE108DA|nr:NADH dehydrogenase subunit 6 [Comanthus parvicirrus]UFQ22715.1 NADH dehydrogenase subunit 6 [Comanthus parvicirrus]UHY39310.1 NADH dehydrogenase subunit 6 [Comanthus parvicirrus]